MVKTKSPERCRDMEIKAGLKGLFGLKASKIQVFDEDLTFINMKKGDQTVFKDKDGFHELSRDNQGRHSLRDLKSQNANGEIQ